MGSTTNCCVSSCPKIYRILHKFPRPDQKRPWKLIVFKIWLYRACNRTVNDEDVSSIDEIVRNFRICDVHFSNFCKLPPCNKLRRGSLPTLLLPSFSETPNEINSQFALLQYCSESAEMQLFGKGYKPPEKWQKEDKNIALNDQIQIAKPEFNEPPVIYTIPEISQQDIELNLQNVIPKHIPLEPKLPEIDKPHFKSVKIYLTQEKCLGEVCRICFCAIHGKDMVKLYKDTSEENNNDCEKFNNMLKQVLPDLDMEIYENCVICTKCKNLLISSFELKTAWLATEEKLQKIIEKEKNNPDRKNSCLVLIAGSATKRKEKNSSNNEKYDHNYALKTNNIELTSAINESMKKKANKEPFYFDVKLLKKRGPPEKGPFLCEKCGQILAEKGSLKKHQFKHCKGVERRKNEQQTKSMCESCGMMFDSLKELKKHSSRKHRIKQPVRYQCEICDKILLNKHSLQKHIRHIHLKIYNYVQCHLCGKKLTTKCALRQHLLMHDGMKRYECEICNKQFYWLPRLKKHLLRHTDDKYSCEICGKLVKHESSLKQHVKIFHMGEGNSNCDVCGKPYWKNFDLIRHKIRVHGWTPEQQENIN